MEHNLDTTLLQQTLDMIELAKSKGFDFTGELKPFMYEHWMPFQEVFCNQASAVISWWLRDRHKLIIWIAPKDNGSFRGYIKYFGVVAFVQDIEESHVYERVFITAITEALNTLPPLNEITG
jgi:hypothetical protein